jgi:colicin import membrane protein
MVSTFNECPESEVEQPTAALAVIDSTPADKLFTPGGVTDAQLAAGREWYLTEAKKYGIETEAKRTELKRFARPLQKLRTGIEARAKEFTGETKRTLAAIDTEKRRLVQIVGGIEDEVLRPLTEWETEEEARKTRLSSYVQRMAEAGQPHLYATLVELETAIRQLEQFSTSDMQEYKTSAESAIAASLKVLKPELARRQEAERNAAELAELRRKQAERDEQDRLAEQKSREEARIAEAAERLAEKMVAEKQAVVQPYIPSAQEERGVPITQEKIAELLAANHNDPASDSNQGHGEPEEQIPSFIHEGQVDHKVAEALMGCGLTRGEAESVLLALKLNLIPHVTITY